MMRATLTIRARPARISGSTAFAGAVLAQLPDVEVVTNHSLCASYSSATQAATYQPCSPRP
jgi:hypothetical protein